MNPYLDFEIFRPLSIFVTHLFSPWIWRYGKVPVQQGTCWGAKLYLGNLVYSTYLWVLLSFVASLVLPAACNWSLGFAPAPGLWDSGSRKQMQASLGIYPEAAVCLVAWLGNMGQGIAKQTSVLKDNLTYLHLRGKVIPALLFSKHLKNLEHTRTQVYNDNK